MQTRVRFGQLGAAHGQFNSPHGFCLGIDEDIVVADPNNHRIQVMMDDEGDLILSLILILFPNVFEQQLVAHNSTSLVQYS